MASRKKSGKTAKEPLEAQDVEIIEAETGEGDRSDAAAEIDSIPEDVPEPEATHIIRKTGFVQLVLGGVVAAAIGFGVAQYLGIDGWPFGGAGEGDKLAAEVAQQNTRLENIGARLTEIEAAPEIVSLKEQLAKQEATLSEILPKLDQLGESFATLNQRLTQLEKRPLTEGASPAAIAAYERELSTLQDAIAAQRAEIEIIAQDASAKEENAEMTAQEALIRTALGQIRTAINTGDRFSAATSDLAAAGVEIPSQLSEAASSGVASMQTLKDRFPEVARAALAISRKNEGGSGLGSFLKTQLGARSLVAREGADADAVLSRAEAALSENRLNDALAEIDALPEAGQAAMSAWVAMAETRQSTVAGLETLSQQLNSN